MQWRLWLVFLAVVLVGVGIVIAEEYKGPEKLILNAGPQGDVPFPHRNHQERLIDCNICHSVFPQKIGVISQMKADGQLAPKDVMNNQCTKCHRSEKKAGNPSGPTTCTKCHMKKG